MGRNGNQSWDVSICFMEKDIKCHKKSPFQHVKGAFFRSVARSKAGSPPTGLEAGKVFLSYFSKTFPRHVLSNDWLSTFLKCSILQLIISTLSLSLSLYIYIYHISKYKKCVNNVLTTGLKNL